MGLSFYPLMKTTLRIKQSNVPMPLFVVALVLFGCGAFALFIGNWLGLLPMLLASVAFVYWDGTEIDFAGRRIREFSAVGPLRFGEWQTLHAGNETQLRSVAMAYTSTSRSMQTNTYLNGEFKLMLRLHNGKFALVKRSEKREELEKLEEEILRKLGA